MSAIIVAAIIISLVVFICLILISIDNKERKKASTELLNHFSKLGTENKLSFSSQEILETCIIGLDKIQRKLLVLKKIDKAEYDSILLDLNDVKKCTKRNIYIRINIGTSKKERFEDHIDKIVLDFDFMDNRQPVQILFFEHVTNDIFAMPELEKKANKWEAIVSQITNTGLRKIA
ncbi:MAG TPA: hypothetical protein VF144_05810 [Chitinophagaceae bacterium]